MHFIMFSGYKKIVDKKMRLVRAIFDVPETILF